MDEHKITNLTHSIKTSTIARKKLLLTLDTLLDKIDTKLLELAEILENKRGS